MKNIDERIEMVDQCLEDNNVTKAIEKLSSLAKEFPEEGIIPFYFGRISLLLGEDELAIKYFAEAEKLQYNTVGLYLSLGLSHNSIGNFSEAEKYFLKAIKCEGGRQDKWASLSALSAFYIEHEMYLKAEKMVKKLIFEYPDNYQGHHMHVIIEIVRGHYEEAYAYLNLLPEDFHRHPQYLLDIIDLYKSQKKNNELHELLDRDERFTEVIPQIALREKLEILSNDESTIDEKEKLIIRLAKEYHDKDAFVSLMILHFSKRDFRKSAAVANIILDAECKKPGIRYYLALYFQIYNLYYLSNKKPSPELRQWIEKASQCCVSYVNEIGISEASEVVISSLQDLFNEINITVKVSS